MRSVTPHPPIVQTGQAKASNQIYPFVVILGRAEHDSRLFDLRTRLLIAMQQAWGASFAEWTPPLLVRDIARYFHVRSERAGAAVRDLVDAGYLERHPVSHAGGNLYQYKLVAPRPGWVGIASSLGEVG